MENPGLKRLSVNEPYIKVVKRRIVAAPPPMVTPHTNGTGYAGVPPEPGTQRQDVQTPPSLAGGVSAPAVSATNGLPPLDINPTQTDATRASDDRRMQQQQQVGGGKIENPAYDRAQEQIKNKLQMRRAHPLHQANIKDLPEYGVEDWPYGDERQFHPDIERQVHPGGPDDESWHMLVDHQILDEAPDRVGVHGDDYSNPGHFMSIKPGGEAGEATETEGGIGSRTNLWSDPSSSPEELDAIHPLPEWRRRSSWEDNPAAQRGELSLRRKNDEDNLVGFIDPTYRPITNDLWSHHVDQPMFQIKEQYEADKPDSLLDPGWHTPGPACETCYLKYGDESDGPDKKEHDSGYVDHPYKPMTMEPGQRYSSVHQANDDLWQEFGERPEDREETVPSDEQARHLEGLGFEPYEDTNGPYWLKHHQGNEYMIGPSRDEPRGGYWETSIGPINHSAEDADEPVHPTMHNSFENAVQRMQDPDTWASQHMMDQDLNDVEGVGERGYLHAPRRPGPTREFDPHLRDQVTRPPDRRTTYSPDDRRYLKYTPQPPGLQSLNKTSSEPIECEGCGEVMHPDGTKARFRQGQWESGFYHKPCFDWINREVVDDPDSWQFGNDASRSHHFTSSNRTAAQVPNDDPVYPYHPQPHPERDTVDLDNLQEGDDSFRPHHPVVDRVMNEMQGLPDMTRNDPKLMEGVNNILDQYPDTEEGERGANALSMGLNTIFDSTNETKGLPHEERLQRAKDAIDAHFETAQLTHKQHVKQLHDDWEARGGHKTGEPRPVERFSPRYTKPQQIVPDPSNMFPELESPILYVGKCEGCGKKLYDSADSSGDPRGALGEHTVGTIDAAEYSPRGDTEGDRRMHGPSALICPNCDNEQDRHNAILDKYQGHKAGDKTGGGYWGVPFGSPAGTKRQFIPTTYAKDRKGKWHNPGEQVGSCPECDNGITGWHRRGQTSGPMQAEAAWGDTLRREAGLKDDFVDAFRDVRDWSADKPWMMGFPQIIRGDLIHSMKAVRNSGLYDEEGNVVREPYHPPEVRKGLTWQDIKSKPRHVRPAQQQLQPRQVANPGRARAPQPAFDSSWMRYE